MKNVHKDRIIEHISKTLPIISDSVNEIANYINNNADGKLDQSVIKNLKKILDNIKLNDLNSADIFSSDDDQVISLFGKYTDGISEIVEGIQKLVSVFYSQNDKQIPKGLQVFSGTPEEAQKLIGSAVNNLYDGSKVIITVIDKAIEDNS